MRKGQKVRVLADNRVGIVADSHFFHWGGKRMVQYQVKFKDTKGEAPWFPAEKLTTNLEEVTTIVITGEKGILNFTYTQRHDKGNSTLELRGNPENLKEHTGSHLMLANVFVHGLKKFLGMEPEKVEVYETESSDD